MECSRRGFLAAAPGACTVAGVVVAGSTKPATASGGVAGADAVWPEFPRQRPERVQEMVGVCHRDLERVRELLDQQPALANAAWDWGFGDWETALGAAAHTGRRNIARCRPAESPSRRVIASGRCQSVGRTDFMVARSRGRSGVLP